MFKDYTTVEDLLSDESFLAWHFKADPAEGEHWEEWANADPANRVLVEEANAFLQSIQFMEKSLSVEDCTGAEKKLLDRIHALEQASNKSGRGGGKVLSLLNHRSRWIAACFMVLVGGLSAMLYFRTKKSELRTTFGQVQESRLPDGTVVTVNADSHLTYGRGWKDGQDREVWLTGEAFFHVARTPLKSRFIVHANHFDIIVTGTQFNVVSREDQSNVMLKEGSVILHPESGKDVRMVPGDFVEYRQARLQKKPAKTDSVLAWKDRKLIFDNTPVRELVKIIREHYGITVILADENVAGKPISGIMPNDNLEVLLQALEATGNFSISRENDSIYISAP